LYELGKKINTDQKRIKILEDKISAITPTTEDEFELEKLLNKKFLEETQMETELSESVCTNENPEIKKLTSSSVHDVKDNDGNVQYRVRSTVTIEKVGEKARNNTARCKVLHATSGDDIQTKTWYVNTEPTTYNSPRQSLIPRIPAIPP
jgi:hypothetical protein